MKFQKYYAQGKKICFSSSYSTLVLTHAYQVLQQIIFDTYN